MWDEALFQFLNVEYAHKFLFQFRQKQPPQRLLFIPVDRFWIFWSFFLFFYLCSIFSHSNTNSTATKTAFSHFWHTCVSVSICVSVVYMWNCGFRFSYDTLFLLNSLVKYNDWDEMTPRKPNKTPLLELHIKKRVFSRFSCLSFFTRSLKIQKYRSFYVYAA